MSELQFFENLYSDFLETDKYKSFKKHIGIIMLASKYKMALCGSTALHIVTKNAVNVPNDIDFVTDDNTIALTFISEIFKRIDKYKWYGSVLIQNKTNFCFEGTCCHYKIKTSFGFNVCTMVLNSKLKSYFTKEGICVQFIDDLKKYTELASEIDGKERLKIENSEEVIIN